MNEPHRPGPRPAPYGFAPTHQAPHGGYAPPGMQMWPAQAPMSGAAVASFVCAIAGLFTFGLAALPAVIVGHLARRETATGRKRGDGLALAGLIIGWIQVGLGILGLIVLAYLVTGTVDTSPPTVSPLPR